MSLDIVAFYFSTFPNVVSCVGMFRSFDARRECSIRRYSYLLPAEVIGINKNFTPEEIDVHLSDFNRILSGFEVCSNACR